MSNYTAALAPTQDDLQKMLACQVHIGTTNLEPGMQRYVWNRRSDGTYIINLHKTWEKLMLAARLIVAIENRHDVCVISARPWGQRAVLKFANFTGAQAISGRFTPGTFTNQIQEKFMEPRLLIVTDPRTDHQPLRESSYVNIPTIAFCSSDSPLRHVDVAIPANNKGRHAIGLMYWLLAREVLRMRNEIPRTTPWNVMVDLFFFREETESKDEVEEKGGFFEAGAGAITAPEGAGGEWASAGEGAGSWDTAGQAQDWSHHSTHTSDWSAETAPAVSTPAAPATGSWDSSVTSGWDNPVSA